MINKNIKVIKKLGEERYFSTAQELYNWYGKQGGGDADRLIENAEKTFLSIGNAEKTLEYLPLYSDSFRVWGDKRMIKYSLTKGNFIRKSGTYHYCVLAQEKIL